MKLLKDDIHDCENCHIYKENGVPCSIRSEITTVACDDCEALCCLSPFITLMGCERGTIIDKLQEGDYIAFDGIIPYKRESGYCKHIDETTWKCKTYDIRPIACRVYMCVRGRMNIRENELIDKEGIFL